MRRLMLMALTLLFSPLTIADQHLLPSEKNTIEIFQKISPFVLHVHRIQRVVDTQLILHDVRVGTASGFLWNDQGYVVTNYHVIRQASRLAVTVTKGITVNAKVVGVAPRKDIALLKLDDTKILNELPSFTHFPLANSSKLLVGQKSLAIGNPYGLDRTLTTGIISAVGREIPGIAGNIRDMIQTDASINPGNSGGPLLDSEGKLIGMNTLIFSRSGGSAGIGFAVPANEIQRVVNQLIKYGHVKQSGIGISIFNDQVSKYLGINGVIINAVITDTPAAKAELKSTYRDENGQIHIGDVIIGVNNQKIKNTDDLYQAFDEINIGDSVTLKLMHDKKERIVSLPTIDVSE